MEFNSSKCNVMVLNRSCKGLDFALDNKELEIVKSYKYLGSNFFYTTTNVVIF